MKTILFSILMMFVFNITASAQVKTFKTVTEDDAMVVNASNCIDRQGDNYLLWVRYDYKSSKACKKDAKRDGVSGKAVRAEVLYEFDEPCLTYRIVSKKYFDKNNALLKEINYYHAPWNHIGDIDYSLKLGIYMSETFNITVG